MVATGIRRWRTQGTPPICPGSTVMRSKFFIILIYCGSFRQSLANTARRLSSNGEARLPTGYDVLKELLELSVALQFDGLTPLSGSKPSRTLRAPRPDHRLSFAPQRSLRVPSGVQLHAPHHYSPYCIPGKCSCSMRDTPSGLDLRAPAQKYPCKAHNNISY
jgi:hypothetical protein